MKTFKQFLEEALDSSYEHKYEGPFDVSKGNYAHHNYSITPDKKSKIALSIDHRPDDDGKVRGILSFRRQNDWNEGMTGEHPKTAARVLGTVKKILQRHAKEHGVHEYDFKADRNETSRVSLYRKLAQKSGGGERSTNDKSYASFRIKIPKDS